MRCGRWHAQRLARPVAEHEAEDAEGQPVLGLRRAVPTERVGHGEVHPEHMRPRNLRRQPTFQLFLKLFEMARNDVCGWTVMSRHMRNIARQRPDHGPRGRF